jgi:hypothetical protein
MKQVGLTPDPAPNPKAEPAANVPFSGIYLSPFLILCILSLSS